MNRRYILAISFLLSSCSYIDIPKYLDLGDSNLYNQQSNSIDATLAWSVDIGEARDYRTGILQPVFRNGISYTIDSEGHVYAVDLSNGNTLWSYDLDMDVSSGLGLHQGKIFFGTTDGMFYAFDIDKITMPYSILNSFDFINFLDSSKIEPDMKIQLKSEASSAAVGLDDLVYVKLDDGDSTAIDYIKNEIAWSYKGRNVPLSMKGSGSITILNTNIYVPRDDGNLISLSASKGKLNWLVSISPRSGRNELESLRDVEINPIIDNGLLYIGSYQGNLISVDIFNGNIVWSKPMSVMSHMSFDDQYLYVSDNTGFIYALDKYDGSTKWMNKLPKNIISSQTFVTNEFVVSFSISGQIIILNKIDGKILTLKKILGNIEPQSRGLMVDKYLYIVSKDGRLNAIKIN